MGTVRRIRELALLVNVCVREISFEPAQAAKVRNPPLLIDGQKTKQPPIWWRSNPTLDVRKYVPAPLPLRPVPMLRETVPSFLSRIATMNGGDCTGFASDMGFSIKRAIHLDDSALRQLANCGDLSPDQLEDLISWTGQQIGDVQTTFRDEVFVTRAIVNPVVRGCPICLREDAQNDTGKPLQHMVMRGHWQLREVSVCLVHSHLLVPLWEKPNRIARYDYSERFPEVLPKLMNGDFDQPAVMPSPYDHWIDERLATGQDKTWLAQHSLYAATTLCRLLGTELLRLDPPTLLDAIAQRRSAQAIGFDVARQGEVAIRDALDALAAFANGAHDGPKKAFGGLYSSLRKDYLGEEAFAPF